MNLVGATLLVAFVAECLCAIPHKVDRVLDSHLSEEDPGTVEYDHEAFLGKDQAKTVGSLTREEKIPLLTEIFRKIDKDGNNQASVSELKDWITFTQERYINEDTDKQFPAHDEDDNGKITWQEYFKTTYGHLEDVEMNADQDDFSYQDMLLRDKKRWEAACKTDGEDDDLPCDKVHFRKFLHPEEYQDMKEVVLQETMDDLDKNKDGFVDLKEYISDMYKPEDGEEEPDWVVDERKQFLQHRDKDEDGMLNLSEVRDWILPGDYNHAEAEAQHLVFQSDENKDGEITLDEMLEHEDVFVGSQATDWGEALLRHQEL